MQKKYQVPVVTRTTLLMTGSLVAFLLLFFILPVVMTDRPGQSAPAPLPPFPVSVDPETKTIVETYESGPLSLAATSLAAVVTAAGDVLTLGAAAILSTPTYQAVSTEGPVLAVVHSGSRREQVAQVFGSALGWDQGQRLAFLTETPDQPLLATEGRLYPDTYIVDADATPYEVQTLIAERFEERILSRYSAEAQAAVPIEQALTIASLIERETSDKDEMRIISGIIWNRIFANMKLQLDATLQYARGTTRNGWWPVVRSRDKYIESAYNTYQNVGLPPGPISSPSVAAVMAALNPVKTPCIFYFHDKKGNFVCTETYEEHVKELKKAYGRGK